MVECVETVMYCRFGTETGQPPISTGEIKAKFTAWRNALVSPFTTHKIQSPPKTARHLLAQANFLFVIGEMARGPIRTNVNSY